MRGAAGDGPDDVRDRVTVPTTDPQETLAALEAVLDRWTVGAIGVAKLRGRWASIRRAPISASTRDDKPG